MATAYVENALNEGAALIVYVEARRLHARLRWPDERAIQSAHFTAIDDALDNLDQQLCDAYIAELRKAQAV